MATDETLDAERFFRLRDRLREDIYDDTFTQMRRDAKIYRLDYDEELNLPEDHPRVYPPTAKTAVDTADSHINTQWPKITVRKRKGKSNQEEKFQAHVEHARSFYESFFYKASMATGRTDPIAKARKWLFLRGKAILMTMPNTKTLSENIERDHLDPEVWPFLVEAPDPLSIMEDPDNDPPAYVIRARRMRYRAILDFEDLEEDARDILDTKVNGSTEWDYTTVWEYWTPNYLQWYHDESHSLLWEHRHGWGVHPFDIVFSGYGTEDEDNMYTDGLDQGRFPRETLTQGLITPLVVGGILQQEALTSSQVALMQNHAAYVNYLVDARIQGNWNPGTANIYYVPPIQDPNKTLKDMVVAIKGEPPNSELMSYGARTKDEAMSAVAPRAVQGIREPGVNAASHQAQIVAQARLRYASPQQNLERLCTLSARKAAYLHEKVIKKDLTVYGGLPSQMDEVVIKPGDWGGVYDCQVKLQAGEDSERDLRLAAGAELIRTYRMDPVAIAESHGGVDNPREQMVAAIGLDFIRGEIGQQIFAQLIIQRNELDVQLDLGGGQGGTPGPDAEPTILGGQAGAQGFAGTNSGVGVPAAQRSQRQQAAGQRPRGAALPRTANRSG